MNKKELINKWCNCKLYFPMIELKKFTEDLDAFEIHIKDECAMIFESQISEDNTDSANIDLKINAKAIRGSK